MAATIRIQCWEGVRAVGWDAVVVEMDEDGNKQTVASASGVSPYENGVDTVECLVHQADRALRTLLLSHSVRQEED